MFIDALLTARIPTDHLLTIKSDDGGGGGGGSSDDSSDDGGDDDADDEDDDEADEDDEADDDEGDDEDEDDDSDAGKAKGKKGKKGKDDESPQKAAARRKRELVKDPDVQRLIKQASTKAVRDALAAKAKEDEKAKKRAGMEDEERLKAEAEEAKAEAEAAKVEASTARVEREFFQAFTESSHKPRTKKALGMIMQLAAEKVADDGVDWDVAIEELADEEAYLFAEPGEAPTGKKGKGKKAKKAKAAEADDDADDDEETDDADDEEDEDEEDDDADAMTRAARARDKARRRKKRATTQGGGKKTGKKAGATPTVAKDALKMTPEEFRKHKESLGIH